jgi:hypothetical protein
MNAAADALAAAAAAADGEMLATGGVEAVGALGAALALAVVPAPPLELWQASAPSAKGNSTHSARWTFMAEKISRGSWRAA